MQASKVEVAAHVKVLEDTAAVLEAYRAVQHATVPRRGGGGGAAVVEVSSREAVCFATRLPPPPAARPGALALVLEAFHRRGVEVLVAAMTRGVGGYGEATQVTVTAAATAPEVVESIKADIAGIE